MYKIKTIPEDFIVEELFTPPNNEGEYYYTILEKKDEETLSALDKFAKKLQIKNKDVGYGGIKDRRAVTKQYISAHASKEKLENLGYKVVGQDNKSMSLGDHQGNGFKITLRNLDENDVKQLRNTFDNINKDYTFLNLFGEQRFSSNNVEVGIAILQKDFRAACRFVKNHKIEKHLEKYPKDFIGAFSTLSKKHIMLFVHSVQSKMWNTLAKRFDDKIIPLPGYMTEFKNSKIKEFCISFLEDLDLNLRSFAIREIPNLFTCGGERERVAVAKEFSHSNFKDDELHKGKNKVTLSFRLEKSVYATVCVASLFG